MTLLCTHYRHDVVFRPEHFVATPKLISPYEFLALFLIQIGVPTKPKASRI